MTTITIRPIRADDKEAVLAVEAKSTPSLRYLPNVFDMFMADVRGAFILAELAGEVVGCAKFTVLPDETAWLETLRVVPEQQGQGVGKKLYEQFFTIAAQEQIATMRMYTGSQNAVSKGLAERFGFGLEETFLGFSRACAEEGITAVNFQQITDPTTATALLMPLAPQWHNFLVMNRTFYKLTPALCSYLAQKGELYANLATSDVVVLGARFMPEAALHIGLFGGNHASCLQFALQKGCKLGTKQISCLLPAKATTLAHALTAQGFQQTPSPFIVMKTQQPAVEPMA